MPTADRIMSIAPGARKKSKVTLIPWDPESQQHVERLFDQRVACGWKSEKIGKWKELQRQGKMAIQWIVLDPLDPETDSRLSLHTTRYPSELDSLTDSAKSIYGKPRLAPSFSKFNPVGHISIDDFNPYAPELDKLGELYWITTLYVSRAIQGIGLGGSAMDAIEELARNDFQAKEVGLDTRAKETMAKDEEEHAKHGSFKSSLVNQDWYDRRGYKLVLFKKGGYADTLPDGSERLIDLVFMTKPLE